jgi:DNA topoisomerase IB
VDFVVEDSRGPGAHHCQDAERGNRRRPEEESFTSGCPASGIFTRKSPTTGAPPNGRGTGKQWSLRVRDRRIAKIKCHELPGQKLLHFVDEADNCQDVTSTDVNGYLKEIAGKDITARISAPGRERFSRRWRSMNLRALTAPLKRSATFAPRSKSREQARQSPTICHKCYVHPKVLNSHMDGNLVLELKSRANCAATFKL